MFDRYRDRMDWIHAHFCKTGGIHRKRRRETLTKMIGRTVVQRKVSVIDVRVLNEYNSMGLVRARKSLCVECWYQPLGEKLDSTGLIRRWAICRGNRKISTVSRICNIRSFRYRAGRSINPWSADKVAAKANGKPSAQPPVAIVSAAKRDTLTALVVIKYYSRLRG